MATVSDDRFVRILEAGPRDGLQNEKTILPVAERVDFIRRLANAGFKRIEGGAFVSPKWVPQMAGTAEVLSHLDQSHGNRYPVLTPNSKALELFFFTGSQKYTDEIAVFTAASESFNKANLNCTIADSVTMLTPVVEQALAKSLRVRGYVSTVVGCPFEGAVAPERVRELAKILIDLGCYEVSLGDTIGVGNPVTFGRMLNEVAKDVPLSKLGVHCHDTYGAGVANSLFAVEAGVRAVDCAIAGLGGCPYAPGAKGNVASEDIIYALHNMGYATGVDLDAAAQVGKWISDRLGRPSASRAGPALIAKQARDAALAEKAEKAKL
ncbi:3-hydroxy-3-methylglutaryl-CoA lyase [Calocera viscosa TUFC12733]|uniref:hydroxymethylglutaryl-CoA lyase n=1 Tax=Calocera viscosa (strain TUFC12733) TaxID=1330018 RepID=A0A167FS15_CALVF|nr:3-hydroxy-3-methylglutaryl-CoA lyase [Calocera viscosa TUFC12733]